MMNWILASLVSSGTLATIIVNAKAVLARG